jgi:uncharacterized protein YecT (DUF1311 family)
MDSLLNIVYNDLRRKLSTKEKDLLKQEQLAWLKERDRYFKQQYKGVEKEFGFARSEWGEVEYLAVYIGMNDFVKKES